MPDKPLLVLGGADCLWSDLEQAKAICPEYDVAAVNDAGKDYEGHLSLWVTLHPELFDNWQRLRERAGRNTDYTAVSHKAHVNTRIDLIRDELWPGSSGLYVCQIAAINFNYQKIILCGIPMEAVPHYHDSKPWDDCVRYRKGWVEAIGQPELKERIKSMSGYTAELVGKPTKKWLEDAK